MKIELCELEKYYKDILDNNSEYVNKCGMCKICRISKSTAYKLLREGVIPYKKINNGLLHEYKISIVDVVTYLYKKDCKYVYNSEYISKVRNYYEEKYSDKSDVLKAKDICEMLGYAKETVRRWIKYKKLIGIIIKSSFFVAKDDLIDFLVSPYYAKITRKSRKHIIDYNMIEKM